MYLSVFSELSLLIVFAMSVALVMRLIKQPLIIGHILTGILVGPSVLHLIKDDHTVEVFAEFGIALLLFIIGLGLSLKVVKEVGKVAGIVGFVQLSITAAVGYGSSLVLGMSKREAVFLAVAYSFSSTIIILKLLSDKKEQLRLYGKISIGLLLVQDVAATIALIAVTASGTSGVSASEVIGLAVKGFGLSAILLLLGGYVLPRFHKLIAESQEFLFLFALGWGFGAAALFEMIGFSIEIGALIAGVSLASLPYTQEIASRLRPLRDFFVVVFFIALGTRIDFSSLIPMLPLIIFGTFIVMVIKPLTVLLTMGLMGYTKRTSFKSALTMGQISEFSLVFLIIGNEVGIISNEIVGAITMVALITIAGSTYIIMYLDKIYKSVDEHFTLFERSKTKSDREDKHKNELVLFGYLRGGHEFLKLFKSLKKRYIVVDYDPEIAETLDRIGAPHVYGDATDIELLDEIGIEQAKLVVSTINDHDANTFIVKLMKTSNPRAIVVCHAENAKDAAELYDLGASYVMVPHFIGSARISNYIKKSGLKKSDLKKYKDKHIEYLSHRLNVLPSSSKGK